MQFTPIPSDKYYPRFNTNTHTTMAITKIRFKTTYRIRKGSVKRGTLSAEKDKDGRLQILNVAPLDDGEEVYYQDQSTGDVSTIGEGTELPDGAMVLAGDLTTMDNAIDTFVIETTAGLDAMTYEFNGGDPTITTDPEQFTNVDEYTNDDDGGNEDDPPSTEGSNCDGTIGISA